MALRLPRQPDAPRWPWAGVAAHAPAVEHGLDEQRVAEGARPVRPGAQRGGRARLRQGPARARREGARLVAVDAFLSLARVPATPMAAAVLVPLLAVWRAALRFAFPLVAGIRIYFGFIARSRRHDDVHNTLQRSEALPLSGEECPYCRAPLLQPALCCPARGVRVVYHLAAVIL
ncbi:MAG TPA: hypothetical protein VLH79_14305 [Chthonomonadales bacterium]|nr:hypothetical protein [Chthonomonadales bacterium]